MKITSILKLFFIIFLFAGCKSNPPDTIEIDAVTNVNQTQVAADIATAAMEEAKRELMAGQTVTAFVEKVVEEALSTAVAGAVAETLTAIVPPPSITPSQIADTPTGIPTLTPDPSDTPTTQPTETFPPPTQGSLVCRQVIDNWCNTHQGCSTVDVRNQTGMNSSWHIWSDKEAIDATFTIPAGPCTIVTRPGRYNFYITYCGEDEVADFSWVLNDNWWYKLSPCD
jgi:hypothetical protein